MSTSDLALVASIGSAMATILGVVVAFLALRLSAASAPLDFRLLLDGEPTELGPSRGTSHWMRGRLDNVGASCRVSGFRIIDWKSPVRILPGQYPHTANRDDPKTYPRPRAQWQRRRRGISHVTKLDAEAEGLFYPKRMATGTDSSVHVWLPPNVESVELAVEVSHVLSARRSHNFWIDNPLFEPRSCSTNDE